MGRRSFDGIRNFRLSELTRYAIRRRSQYQLFKFRHRGNRGCGIVSRPKDQGVPADKIVATAEFGEGVRIGRQRLGCGIARSGEAPPESNCIRWGPRLFPSGQCRPISVWQPSIGCQMVVPRTGRPGSCRGLETAADRQDRTSRAHRQRRQRNEHDCNANRHAPGKCSRGRRADGQHTGRTITRTRLWEKGIRNTERAGSTGFLTVVSGAAMGRGRLHSDQRRRLRLRPW